MKYAYLLKYEEWDYQTFLGVFLSEEKIKEKILDLEEESFHGGPRQGRYTYKAIELIE